MCRVSFTNFDVMVKLFQLPDTLVNSTLNFLDLRSLTTLCLVSKSAYQSGLLCLRHKFDIVSWNINDRKDVICFLWAFRGNALFTKWALQKIPFEFVNDELLRVFVKLDPKGQNLLPYIIEKYPYNDDVLPQHDHYISMMSSSVYFSCLKEDCQGALLSLLKGGIPVHNSECEPLLCSLVQYGDLENFWILVDHGIFENCVTMGRLNFLKKTIEYMRKTKLSHEQLLKITFVQSMFFTKCPA